MESLWKGVKVLNKYDHLLKKSQELDLYNEANWTMLSNNYKYEVQDKRVGRPIKLKKSVYSDTRLIARCGEVFRIEKVENGLFYFKPKIAGNNIASLYSVSPYDVWFTNEYGQILLENYLGKIVRIREPYYYEEGFWFKRRVYFKNDCVEITHVKPSGKIKRGDIEDGVIGFKCEGGKSYDFGEGIQSTYPGLVTIVEDEQPHKVKEGKCPSVLFINWENITVIGFLIFIFTTLVILPVYDLVVDTTPLAQKHETLYPNEQVQVGDYLYKVKRQANSFYFWRDNPSHLLGELFAGGKAILDGKVMKWEPFDHCAPDLVEHYQKEREIGLSEEELERYNLIKQLEE